MLGGINSKEILQCVQRPFLSKSDHTRCDSKLTSSFLYLFRCFDMLLQLVIANLFKQ